MVIGSLWDVASGLGAGVVAMVRYRRRHKPLSPVNEHPVRRRLVDIIRRYPGVRLSSLWKELDQNRTTTKYHLMILEEANVVTSLKSQQTLRYFPAGTPMEDRLAVSILQRGRVAQMVQTISMNPGIVQMELGKTLRLSRRVIRVYADLLIERGLLAEVIEGKQRRYYPTQRLQDFCRLFP